MIIYLRGDRKLQSKFIPTKDLIKRFKLNQLITKNESLLNLNAEDGEKAAAGDI